MVVSNPLFEVAKAGYVGCLELSCLCWIDVYVGWMMFVLLVCVGSCAGFNPGACFESIEIGVG